MRRLFFFILLYTKALLYLSAQTYQPVPMIKNIIPDSTNDELPKEILSQNHFSAPQSTYAVLSDDAFWLYQTANLQDLENQTAASTKTYLQLSTYYASMGDFEKAYFYSSKAHEFSKIEDYRLFSPQKALYVYAQDQTNHKKNIQLNQNTAYLPTTADNANSYFVSILIFLLVSISVVAALLVSFFYKISQKRKKLNRILEEKVAQKTQHLLKTIHSLEETNKDLDTFLYKASHDLKGPLTTLDGLCNIGLMEVENKTAHEYLTMQKRVIQNLQLLLFRIVEIGNIRHHECNPQPILLDRFCNRLTRSMRREDGFENVRFVVDVPKALSLETDQEMLEIALDNLLKNALQHANYPSHKKGKVTLTTSIHKDEFVVTVHDNGQGVLPEIQHKIFDMFFRGTDHFKGFGLGLYKAKIAIRKLGGEIYLKHSLPGDTLFEIRLPTKYSLVNTKTDILVYTKSF